MTMTLTTSLIRASCVGAATLTILACAGVDRIDATERQPASMASAAAAPKFWENGASVYWNGVLRDLTVKYRPSQQAGVRGFAYLSLAQYEAVIAAERDRGGATQPSEQGAVGAASVAVLSFLFPNETNALEALLAAAVSAPQWAGARHTDFATGVAIGRQVGAAVIASAATDGFTSAPLPVPVCPACWYSLANPPAPPVFARLGEMRPFFLTVGSQFRPGPPPAFGSPEFDAALAVVRQISDTRTAYQDSIAKFWATPLGFVVAQSYTNLVATQQITDFHLTERKAAHALALMNMTAMDTFIACHDAKYTYWLLRPSEADAGIKPDIPVPNHPSYPSNHACVTGSSMDVLAALFPSRAAELTALGEQAGLSRVFAGIHYPFDVSAGLELARRVAQWALDHDVDGHEAYALQ